ncbi:hypothetical protein C0992_008043 [Termitomyces sp. T32_za158]|nr:hypothetical protein C0992_008043 [Termitomyces sp. T32_za158]
MNEDAYVAEFDNAESASSFHLLALEERDLFTLTLGDNFEAIDKSFNVIARFVPCIGPFDPNNLAALRTIKHENNLPPDCIPSANWLKNPDRRALPTSPLPPLKSHASAPMPPML